MASASPYVELRCKSAFSFLEGASLPEDLIGAAAALGYDTIALGDRGGLYGAPRFFRAARAAGVRPLVGAEVKIEAAPPLLLLVQDRRGYKNLCRLLTVAKEGRPKGEGAATYEDIAVYAPGLLALAGPAPREDLARLRDIFGAQRLYVEAQRHLDDEEAHTNRKGLEAARALALPIVATNDVRYAAPQAKRAQDVLTCLRLKTKIDEAGRRLLRNAERHLKPPEAMAALFHDQPEALHATRAIAERCSFTLADLGYSFPTFPVPASETEQSLLEKLTWQGAARRYRPITDKVRRQLEHELGIIGRLGLAGYFLVVWDIVEHARSRGILVQGRGSAANSATCYALGITAVDPVGMELLFERFLSEERVRSAPSAADRVPDIDLDLPSGDRREDVIQHVYRKYGPRGAGMTANVITYRPRMAVRDTGRALGFSEEHLNRIAKHLPGWIHEDEKPLAGFLADAGFPPTEDSDDRTRHLAEIATQLLNLPRHLGQHSGGMVICHGRLDEVVPLEPASMPGRVVVEWDKDDCADLGIVKVDLLGLGMLAVLEDAVPLIRAHEGVAVDYAHLPPDDPDVYRMLRAADTVGVFQVESRAQMATLPRMKPERFYDLVVEVAIIRPGPIVGKMVNPYLLRRQDREPVRYPHPSLEPILKRTLGVPLFQEQLIRMAMVAAGFSGGQAEELRRAMGFKRSVERMKGIEQDLRAGMARHGITGAAADEIVQGIKSFALYGFPESHAASFALIAYASAYLKAHHGAAFLCALLNNYPMGFYHPATLVTDAIRHDIEVRPIDVQRSDWLCTLENDDAHDGSRARRGAVDEPQSSRVRSLCSRPTVAVRVGLRYAAGLREKIGRKLVAERATRPFHSVADFYARVEPNEAESSRLAEIGAFASLGGTRRAALWQVDALGKSGALFVGVQMGTLTGFPCPPAMGSGGQSPPAPDAIKGPPRAEPAGSPLEEMSAVEETFADFRGTGMTTGPHPASWLRPQLERFAVTPAAELGRLRDGSRARIGGIVIVRQRPGTAKGIVFITLEDETGFSNAVVYPDRFDRWRNVILTHPTLVIDGIVQNRDGVTTLLAESFSPLGSPGSELDVSHDFH